MNRRSVIKRSKRLRSKTTKEERFISLILTNHSITDDKSFHLIAEVSFWLLLLILSRINLLIFPTLDLFLLGKLALWYFIVIFASASLPFAVNHFISKICHFLNHRWTLDWFKIVTFNIVTIRFSKKILSTSISFFLFPSQFLILIVYFPDGLME